MSPQDETLPERSALERPKVIHELCSYLAGFLRSGLRSGPSAELFPVYWGHPRDFDEQPKLDGISPLVGFGLLEVRPDRRLRSAEPFVETGKGLQDAATLESTLKPAPTWLTCDFVLSIRSESPVEEQELIAAVYELLTSDPLVPLDAFPSLRDDESIRAVASGFPIVLVPAPGLWHELSLRRHRLLARFEVTVPLPSRRRRHELRVAERALDLRVDTVESTRWRADR